MAGAIRLTRAERGWLVRVLGEVDYDQGVRDAILDKLDKSELVKARQPAGIGWKVAADAMREVLGARLAVPANPAVGWIVQMSNRIKNLGLTAGDCRTVARVLEAKGWKTYSFEKAIWAADRLLQEAQLELAGTEAPRSAHPLEMDDQD